MVIPLADVLNALQEEETVCIMAKCHAGLDSCDNIRMFLHLPRPLMDEKSELRRRMREAGMG